MRKISLLLSLFVTCIPALAQQPAEQERNKQIARSFFEEVLDQGHLDSYAESHAKDFVAHGGTHEATLEEDIAAAKEERKALPDMRVTVNQIVAERPRGGVLDRGGHQHSGRNGFPRDGQKDQD